MLLENSNHEVDFSRFQTYGYVMYAAEKSFIDRPQEVDNINKLLKIFPVVAILGARQCGKTTLSGLLPVDHRFDLENPRDAARLETPQLALEELHGLIVIDEIQRVPELFPLLRYLVDTHPKQRYVILGSASRDLIQQSSESLAGRIGYHYLSGFSLPTVGFDRLKKLWLTGGFPRSYLATDDEESALWREQFITTFLERDIPQLGITVPAHTLRRFWTMLSHYHVQTLNFSEFGRSFGVSDMTVRRYVDILEGAFMVRTLRPWHENMGKRIRKAPKLYMRDSGLFHSLQGIDNMDRLLSHNKLGASWEGFCIEQITDTLKENVPEFYYWGTHSGAEVDLFWQTGGKRSGVEVKYADAPRMTKSMRCAKDTLKLDDLYVLYPGKETYRLDSNTTVLSLKSLLTVLTEKS
jgi:uncharacterized protein